jgi:hypothetical protein
MNLDPDLTEVELLAQSLRALANKQVEFLDRLRLVEERLDAFMERVRQCEERIGAAEKKMEPKPPRRI